MSKKVKNIWLSFTALMSPFIIIMFSLLLYIDGYKTYAYLMMCMLIIVQAIGLLVAIFIRDIERKI